jgi:hypothetical protein
VHPLRPRISLSFPSLREPGGPEAPESRLLTFPLSEKGPERLCFSGSSGPRSSFFPSHDNVTTANSLLQEKRLSLAHSVPE